MEEVRGHCSVIVWEEPIDSNGVITNYTLLFFLDEGNDSGIYESSSEVTHYEISSQSLPKSPENASGFVQVRELHIDIDNNVGTPIIIGHSHYYGNYLPTKGTIYTFS